MRFQEYLTEKRKRNVISCDVQPIYNSAMGFKLWEYCEFLNQNNKILYLFNGPETVGGDSKNKILNWLYEEGELNEEKFNDFTWLDKGYAFLRGWMDQGVSDRDIIQALRYMGSKRVWDSRDIEEDEWVDKFPELEGISFDDSISFPGTIDIGKLKRWSGSLLAGGGINECLKEIQLLMNAYNIKYTLVKKFTY